MNKLNVIRELISPAVCLDIEHFHNLFFPTFSPLELSQRRQVLEAATIEEKLLWIEDFQKHQSLSTINNHN